MKTFIFDGVTIHINETFNRKGLTFHKDKYYCSKETYEKLIKDTNKGRFVEANNG